MSITERFCPRCGGKTDDDGMCPACKLAETTIVEVTPRVTCTYCPTCDSVKTGQLWGDTKVDRETLASELALSAIHLHEDAIEDSFEFTIREPTPNRSLVTIHITGEIYGLPFDEEHVIRIVWIKEQCDRCSRYSGGYYNGTIQIRATDRLPSEFEKAQVVEIATELEETLQENGERLSFITRSDETKDGVDFIVSSHHLGELIARESAKKLGGKITTHPKLIGERDGKPLYRVTYLVRLPRYRKGDVIFFSGKYFEIRNSETRQVFAFDLQLGKTLSFPSDLKGRMIGNVRNADSALVAYREGDMVGILDPETFVTRECLLPPWLAAENGEEIRVLKDIAEDQLVLVG